MNSWAARIPVSQAFELASMRLCAGTEYAEADGYAWIRGKVLNEAIAKGLNSIPGLQTFEWLTSDWLKSPELRIPERLIPQTEWRPLRTALQPSFPSAALPGETRQKLSITLIRTHQEQSASALIVDFESWFQFAIHAPAVRLEGLRFAVSAERQVLVLGHPLPSLKGLQLVDHSGILVPAGLTWSPMVDATVLGELFSKGAEDLVILFEDATHQLIKPEQLMPANRSAVRLTAPALP